MVRKNGSIEFLTSKAIGIADSDSFVTTDTQAIQTQFVENGGSLNSSALANPEALFATAETFVQTQMLVLFFEEKDGYHVTVVGRDGSGNFKKRTEKFRGAFPNSWMSRIMGYNALVNSVDGSWFLFRSLNRPCVLGAQAVVLEPASRFAFVSNLVSDNAKIVVECVRSSQDSSIYRVLLGMPNSFSIGGKSWIPEVR